MEKATLNAAIQHAQAREDFVHSAENRRRGPERELTDAERDDGMELMNWKYMYAAWCVRKTT